MIDFDLNIKNAKRARLNATSEEENAYAMLQLKVMQELKAEKTALTTAKNAKPYTSEAEIKMLQKLIKEKETDAQCYWAADRDDIAMRLEEELLILRSLVPAAPSREEIDKFVAELIPGLDGEVKMGEIIKMVKSEFPAADGKTVSEIVKSYM